VAAPHNAAREEEKLRQLRRWRIPPRSLGHRRPAADVRHFSNEHIYVQFIDDAKGITLASASTRDKSTPGREHWRPMSKAPKKSAPSPRGGKGARASRRSSSTATAPLINGKVKALGEAAREAGLKF